MIAENLKNELLVFGNEEKATHSKYFFKTGKGQYGEGDVFIGTTVPESRSVAKKFKKLPLSEIQKLLLDEIHECRFCALIILNEQFKKAGEVKRKEILNFYLSNTHRINNWDLVDVSAYNILGEWLKDKEDRSLLYQLAQSKLLWDQRIAIVSTLALIKNKSFTDTLKLSEIYLTHTHDLIHKASGWMLREVGKRNENVLTEFLDQHCLSMPRTMLRYAIEKFPVEQRRTFLERK